MSCASILALCPATIGAAHAQLTAQKEVSFNIPAQPLSGALREFSKQSGYRLIFPAKSAAGLRAGPLMGAYSSEIALQKLLLGTPLRVAGVKSGMISLRASAVGPQDAPTLVRIAQSGPASGVMAMAAAQSAAQAPADALSGDDGGDIVVIGSQIKGATTTGALPVSVIGVGDIQATGAVSANELFRTLPEAGDVSFNEQWLGGNSPNGARGDVSTVSLRGLGQGNTLLLLNGRRVVTHPTSQADLSIPVFGYNVNAIPVEGLQRVEVLRDGAAALYGSDAVAGVVNNVLRTDVRGLLIDSQFGFAEDSNLSEFQISGATGMEFAENRGKVTLFASFSSRTKINAGEQSFTGSADRRALVAGTSFANVANFDTRGNQTTWGTFQSPAASGIVRSNGVALTNASGQFHIQPTSSAGCVLTIGSGICIDDGPASAASDPALRYDSLVAHPEIAITPSVKRVNVFSMFDYKLSDAVTLFGEAAYYTATTESLIAPTSLINVAISVPASNYYNPFGSTASPNRLPGLNIPTEGLPVTLASYILDDVGTRPVTVKNDQLRLLAGLRGDLWGWSWESAALYSSAKVRDTSQGVSHTLFQQALARSTPDAYNPFSGGNPAQPSGADTSPSADISSFIIENTRANKTTLALWDFKVSNAHLFALPAADLGIAFGVELRRETYKDDRDPRQDGTIIFRDSVSGRITGSDLMQSSPSLDVDGRRTVLSAYAELSIPVIGKDMNIPLVQSIDVQLAGRYEGYSDVGSVAKPKVAVAWDVVDGVRLRGSWSQGFKAPNLETLNTPQLERIYGGVDYVQCEADLRARRITSFTACTRNISVTSVISGNPNLKPEESESYSFGMVLQPRFLSSLGDFTFTVDRWGIKQTGIVGILSDQNAIILDYFQRLNGSSNSNVVRLAPSASDVATFAGTGIDPVGQISRVSSQFQNLLPRDVQGLDLAFTYRSPPTSFGRFTLNVNASHLIKFFQAPSSIEAQLLAVQRAGQISPTLPIAGTANLVRDAGRPDWKLSGTLSWQLDDLTISAFTQYIGSVNNTGVLDPTGSVWQVESSLTTNLYAQYKFNTDSLGGATALRIGVRNLTNEKPPLAATGYLASLYQPVTRYWYFGIEKQF